MATINLETLALIYQPDIISRSSWPFRSFYSTSPAFLMWLLDLALRRPVSIIVAVISIALCAVLALTRMNVDIFPDLNMPVIFVVQPYGGMDPTQMEGYLADWYEYHFFYISGIKAVESKNIAQVSVIKLTFHPDTNMAEAMANTIAQVERSRAFMPPGTVGPFVLRFDAGSVPAGYLVVSSKTRSVNQLQDMAITRVRPIFSSLPGVSGAPAFGGNQRSIVITVDPSRLRAYGMSADEVVKALATGNAIVPNGDVRIGKFDRLASINAVVKDIQDLRHLPVRLGHGPAVFIRDVARIDDASDVLTGYALVNGHRTVYIPVVKLGNASTLSVVNEVKGNIAKMQHALPLDCEIKFVFDQSVYVTGAIADLVQEGIHGALLTGLMVLLFLRDIRSALIVLTSIPTAVLAGLTMLWLSGQTINIMTLGGLALAIGILVDEATVTIENIHTHLALGEPLTVAVMKAGRETVSPRFLAMLSVISVFVPSFFMEGATKALFVPLSLAVGFCMLASYILSSTLVPVISIWFLKPHHKVAERPVADLSGEPTAVNLSESGAVVLSPSGVDEGSNSVAVSVPSQSSSGSTSKTRTTSPSTAPGFFDRVKNAYGAMLKTLIACRFVVIPGYALFSIALIGIIYPILPSQIFPDSDTGQFELRMRAPTGTRFEETEKIALRVLEIIGREAGPGNVEISIGYVGTQPPAYALSNIYVFTSGPHEAVLTIALKESAHIRLEAFKERLRKVIPQELPGTRISFEAGDIVSKIMNFGAPTPIEVAVSGMELDKDRAFADKVMANMNGINRLRDIQYEQPLNYPSVSVKIDRERAGQLGVTLDQVGKSLVEATSSSRWIQPNYWRDPNTGVSYQVQVELPQWKVGSLLDLGAIPAMPNGSYDSGPFVRDVATLDYGIIPGEIDHFNQKRLVSISANLHGNDLGRAAKEVEKAIKDAGAPPRGVFVDVRGQIPTLGTTFAGLQLGVVLAVGVIFLMLTANFQSPRLAIVVLCVIPAIIAGEVVALLVTGTTLNVQSFMGGIMAIGVGVSNAILLITFAEENRVAGRTSIHAAIEAGRERLRPVLMTSIAMIAGMVPMAMSAGAQASLARAVIGGLLMSTPTVLIILPVVFSMMQEKAKRTSASLHPEDVVLPAETVMGTTTIL